MTITGPALFRRVADAIEAQPDAYDQTSWMIHEDATVDVGSLEHAVSDLFQHKCGTTACLAGWAIAVNYGEKDNPITEATKDQPDWAGVDSFIEKTARELYEIDRDQAEMLFSGGWTPPEGKTVPTVLRELADRQEANNGRLTDEDVDEIAYGVQPDPPDLPDTFED
jgi:hypothetical protein